MSKGTAHAKAPWLQGGWQVSGTRYSVWLEHKEQEGTRYEMGPSHIVMGLERCACGA